MFPLFPNPNFYDHKYFFVKRQRKLGIKLVCNHFKHIITRLSNQNKINADSKLQCKGLTFLGPHQMILFSLY